MKILKLIFVIFLILFVSCDEQKIETEFHKIADINGKFPLPKDYIPISSEKAMELAGGMNRPNSGTLTNKMNAKLNHFIDKNDERNLVSITTAESPKIQSYFELVKNKTP